MFIFEIPYEPVSWAAPKLSRTHTYDPREADKRAIRFLIKQQYDAEPLTCRVLLAFQFYFPVPKSASKAKKQAMLLGDIIPTKRDVSNCVKLYEDCLKKIVIEDDRQVEFLCARKLYSEKPLVRIKVVPADEYQETLYYADHC
jgi:Holliday junction resolvase RusA-like endonuclease